MINTQQLIALLPLFKVKIPANALVLFEKIMEIAAFDIYEVDEPLDKMLNVAPTGPFRPGFETVGFESIYLINNLDALNFAYGGWFLVAVMTLILKCFTVDYEILETLQTKLSKTIFFNPLI